MTRKRCAYLTMDNPDGWTIDADPGFEPLQRLGWEILSIEPVSQLLESAELVMSLVGPVPAYARADFVHGRDDRYLVMELELVEPSMYLRMNADAPRRFAEAFDQCVRYATGRDMQ